MERPALQLCNKRWRRVVEGNTLERISAVHEQDAEFRFANSCGVLQHRLEDRLQIAGRAADDLQDLGSRGLLLKRLAQLVKQARVVDGDDGLVSEAGDQSDLFVGEGANLSSVDEEGADELGLLAHWHGDERPRAAVLGRGARAINGGFVDRVNELLRLQKPIEGSTGRRPKRAALSE